MARTRTVFLYLMTFSRFQYTHTDGRGWPTYQYINPQHQAIYLHFYDEGLFYDGFYVINDLEVGVENISLISAQMVGLT